KLTKLCEAILNFALSSPKKLWIELPQLFDRAIFVNKELQMVDSFDFYSYERWKQDLINKFPQDRAYINLKIQEIQQASNYKWGYLLKFLPRRLAILGYTYFGKKSCMNVSFYEFLNHPHASPLLKNILSAQFANYGFSPKTCPFGFAASVIDHYAKNGAYYPINGPDGF